MSYSIDFANLPYIIAGPILRAVAPRSVSVWIAAKVAGTSYTLKVKDDLGNVILIGSKTILPLANLFGATVITARPPVGEPDNTLAEDTNYYYDIEFYDGATTRTLASAGALNEIDSPSGAISKILLDPDDTPALPSFKLLPSDVTKLSILHGSCRKPHGEAKDAFTAYYKVLRDTRNNPLLRPQCLFLTGDQIYADDVCDLLMKLIQVATSELYTVTEKLPNIPDPEENLAIGRRAKAAVHAGFTVDSVADAANDADDLVGTNHLMKINEFYLMYLFCWSDALWPKEPGDWPSIAQVYGPGSMTEDQVKKYADQINRLPHFLSDITLYVRKVLANVAVYMILDDHEITDDLYINQDWVYRTTNDLGRRVLSNGLGAYMVFQDWGNSPEKYESGTGIGALVDIAYQPTHVDDPVQDREGLMNAVLPVYDVATSALTNPSGTLSWNYMISNGPYEILVLDTRTNRSYLAADGAYPALLSLAASTTQVPAEISSLLELTIVVAPSPVLGEELIESLLKLAGAFGGKEYADNEAWGYNARAFERLLARFSTRSYTESSSARGRFVILSGDVHYAFSNRLQYKGKLPYGTETERTPEVEFVVAQLTSSANKNEIAKTRVMHMAGRITSVKIPLLINEDVYPIQMWGYNNPTPEVPLPIYSVSVPSVGTVLEVSRPGNPILMLPLFEQNDAMTLKLLSDFPLSPADFDFTEPDWRYRIDPIFDRRGEVRNFTYVIESFLEAPYDPGETQENFLQHYIKVAKTIARDMTQMSSGKGLVGYNNAGWVTFSWPEDDEEKEVIHQLFWRVPPDFASATGSIYPEDNTHHHVPFGFNLPEYPILDLT